MFDKFTPCPKNTAEVGAKLAGALLKRLDPVGHPASFACKHLPF